MKATVQEAGEETFLALAVITFLFMFCILQSCSMYTEEAEKGVAIVQGFHKIR